MPLQPEFSVKSIRSAGDNDHTKTMKTKVAIRDSPHRFQVVPLRDIRNNVPVSLDPLLSLRKLAGSSPVKSVSVELSPLAPDISAFGIPNSTYYSNLSTSKSGSPSPGNIQTDYLAFHKYNSILGDFPPNYTQAPRNDPNWDPLYTKNHFKSPSLNCIPSFARPCDLTPPRVKCRKRTNTLSTTESGSTPRTLDVEYEALKRRAIYDQFAPESVEQVALSHVNDSSDLSSRRYTHKLSLSGRRARPVRNSLGSSHYDLDPSACGKGRGIIYHPIVLDLMEAIDEELDRWSH